MVNVITKSTCEVCECNKWINATTASVQHLVQIRALFKAECTYACLKQVNTTKLCPKPNNLALWSTGHIITYKTTNKILIVISIFAEVGAGGVIGVNIRTNIKVLSSQATFVLDPWMAGKVRVLFMGDPILF